METVKEKLMNLIQYGGFKCGDDAGTFADIPCEGCRYEASEDCMAERIADALIQNGVTIQEWVSVDERLPITEKEALEYYEMNSEFPQFIVKIDVGVTATVLEFNGKDWFDGYATYNVTHWQPLPELPKEVRKNE